MRSARPTLIFALVIITCFTWGSVSADTLSRGGGRQGGLSQGSLHRDSTFRGGDRHSGFSRGGEHRAGFSRSYGFNRGHFRSGFDVSIGWPWWGYSWYYPYYYPYYPYYYPYYSPYYYPPAVSAPSTPEVYLEKSAPEPSSEPEAVWYYCPESKTYYPYVKECPGGWQTVPAQPSSERVR
jgi:hypothetical protein